MTESQHFKTGTFVIMNNLRGEILESFSETTQYGRENFLTVQWDDGTVSVVQPFALNRNGLSH